MEECCLQWRNAGDKAQQPIDEKVLLFMMENMQMMYKHNITIDNFLSDSTQLIHVIINITTTKNMQKA